MNIAKSLESSNPNNVIICADNLQNAIHICEHLHSDISVKYIAISNKNHLTQNEIYIYLCNFISNIQIIFQDQNFSALQDLTQLFCFNLEVFNSIDNIDILLNTMLDIIDDILATKNITLDSLQMIASIIEYIQQNITNSQLFEFCIENNIIIIPLDNIDAHAKSSTVIYDITLTKALDMREYKHNNVLSLDTYNMYYYKLGLERYNLLLRYIDTPNKGKIQGAIIGMSYVQRGINIKRLSKPTVCLAAPGQDLFYDYEMLKYAYNTGISNLNFCIVEVNPYRLWYDMSLSKATMHRSIYYIPQTGTSHHHPNKDVLESCFLSQDRLYRNLFGKDIIRSYYELIKQQNNTYDKYDTNIFAIPSSTEESYADTKEEVTRIFNKNYPLTYAENVEVMHNIMKFLQSKNVHAFLVMPPFPKLFRDNMNYEMYQTTLNFLQELNETYKSSSVIDYTGCEAFDDYYFSDWSHLNYWGSNLLTDLLNNEINKLYH